MNSLPDIGLLSRGCPDGWVPDDANDLGFEDAVTKLDDRPHDKAAS